MTPYVVNFVLDKKRFLDDMLNEIIYLFDLLDHFDRGYNDLTHAEKLIVCQLRHVISETNGFLNWFRTETSTSKSVIEGTNERYRHIAFSTQLILYHIRYNLTTNPKIIDLLNRSVKVLEEITRTIRPTEDLVPNGWGYGAYILKESAQHG